MILQFGFVYWLTYIVEISVLLKVSTSWCLTHTKRPSKMLLHFSLPLLFVIPFLSLFHSALCRISIVNETRILKTVYEFHFSVPLEVGFLYIYICHVPSIVTDFEAPPTPRRRISQLYILYRRCYLVIDKIKGHIE